MEQGLVTEPQLRDAIDEQGRTGERLDHVLIRMGFANRDQVLEAIGHQLAMPIVDLDAVEVKPDVLSLLPPRLVFKQQCVPIEDRDGSLRIATSDPFELATFDELRLLTGRSIELVLADERDLRKFIRTHYGVAGDTLDELGSEEEAVVEVVAGDELDAAQEASVIRLVNDLLLEAVRERATDVHIEPYEDELTIRYRIDGVLSEAGVPRTVSRFRNAIVSRIKIIADLDIAEKRLPQDGRISLRHRSQEFDIRVSIIPMLFGEGVVLRILDSSAALLELDALGMEGDVRSGWNHAVSKPHGIVLVTGPTGSGKSTTLYASLNQIVTGEVKAITVEDPVEYHIEGVNQIHVHAGIGLTFAAGLRAVLRHDPDIIMIGEIRDLETAEAAVQASLTGHLVLSTLHTNDAAGAMPRLMDMGVEPFLVASSIEAVMAQRLVRRICSACTESYRPAVDEYPADLPPLPDGLLHRGIGCKECRGTGYRGRVGIYELLVMDESLRSLVLDRSNAGTIAKTAAETGLLHSLRHAGFSKVREGVTTASEIHRAVAR
jgi:general secretion pathway protein E/type IV pilus assembly protein PilB